MAPPSALVRAVMAYDRTRGSKRTKMAAALEASGGVFLTKGDVVLTRREVSAIEAILDKRASYQSTDDVFQKED